MQEIRLELARDHDFPTGSSRHGYILKAPLDAEGRLDHAAWRHHPSACTVRRFWGGDEEETGQLTHGRAGWTFTYGEDEVDEPLFRLGEHKLKTGEYVSITEHDGVQRTFRVIRVSPASSK